MAGPIDIEKRNLVARTAVAGVAIAGGLILPSDLAATHRNKNAEKNEAEVTPLEDLMRVHGLNDRLLLVYEAGLLKFSSNQY